MERQEFVNFINKRLSEGCGIPINLSANRINTITDDTKKLFYENYTEVANEEVFMIIPMDVQNTNEFKNNNRRIIVMPKCTRQVYGLTEIGGRGRYTDDYWRRSIGANQINIYSSPENVVYALAMDSYRDFVESLELTTVAFSWNEHTKNLSVKGRNFQTDLVATCYIDIPEESLFESYNFQQYVLGESELSLAKQNMLVKQKLIGGYEIDWSIIKEAGDTRIEKTTERLDELSNTTFIATDGDFDF